MEFGLFMGGFVHPDLMEGSIELFGTQVIPELDRDPEHSTSRYRREAAERLARV